MYVYCKEKTLSLNMKESAAHLILDPVIEVGFLGVPWITNHCKYMDLDIFEEIFASMQINVHLYILKESFQFQSMVCNKVGELESHKKGSAFKPSLFRLREHFW